MPTRFWFNLAQLTIFVFSCAAMFCFYSKDISNGLICLSVTIPALSAVIILSKEDKE